MTDIQLVIFDCDGVLMDSEITAAAAEIEIYKEFGVEMTAHEFASRFAGKDKGSVIKELEAELGRALPDDIMARIRTAIDDNCGSKAEMIAGADTVLDELDQARCICSNGPQEKMKRMLTRVGLYDRFRPYIFSAKDFDPPIHKPKPDLVLKALEEFSVEPKQAVMVEDSMHGIGAARAAGVRTIGFTGATHTYPTHADDLIDAGAETVISRLRDLPAVIEAFTGWDGLD